MFHLHFLLAKRSFFQCGGKGEGFVFNIELGGKVHGRMIKEGIILVKNATLPNLVGFRHTLGEHWNLTTFGNSLS